MTKYKGLMGRAGAALGIVLFAVMSIGSDGDGCDRGSRGSSAISESRQVEDNQRKMSNAIPMPRLETSLERKNLARRAERLNRENQTSYVYLFDHGRLIAFYTVSGKVSSLNSFMTTTSQLIRDPNCSGQGCQSLLMESPDIDGSYGENAHGVFFFTTDGAYVEWSGTYFWTDRPLKLTQPPELVIDITPEKQPAPAWQPTECK